MRCDWPPDGLILQALYTLTRIIAYTGGMLGTLRSRLLISYVLLLAVTLCVIGVTLVLILGTRPLQEVQNRQRLTDIAESVRWQRLLASDESARPDPGAIRALLQNLQGVRLLLVDLSDRRVLFDSGSAPGSPLGGKLVMEITESQTINEQERLIEGEYDDPKDGRRWMFAARTFISQRLNGREIALCFAMIKPAPSLSNTFVYLGTNLLLPLGQAGLIGLVAAGVLALVIARSLAKPLQDMAAATQAVASGDYARRVEESGPYEVRALAVSFNRMTQEVQANRQAQRDFLANVSHELRTPLTSIQGFSQAIADGTAADPDSVQHAAEVIHEEAARLNRMVNNLLDLARIESGRWTFNRQRLDLRALLGGMVERMRPPARERGLDLSLDAGELPAVIGDGDRIAQVLMNLIGNALKYARTRVKVAARPHEGGVEISVIDDGPGIPPEDLSHIFERFYRVEKSRARDSNGGKGVGLGLTISREIVAAHGGRIGAESRAGYGSRFIVWLPAALPDDQTLVTERA
jgi:signal transduction histidine kinase